GAAAAGVRIRTPPPRAATAIARPSSPVTSIASCGQAGTQSPQRMQAPSSIRTSGSCTSTAPVGQTRTHARHATHALGSIEKINGEDPGSLGVRGLAANMGSSPGRVKEPKTGKFIFLQDLGALT